MLILILDDLWRLMSFQFKTYIPNAGIAFSIAFWVVVLLSALCIFHPRWWTHALCFASSLCSLAGALLLKVNYNPPDASGWDRLSSLPQSASIMSLLCIFGILVLAGLYIFLANICRTPTKK